MADFTTQRIADRFGTHRVIEPVGVLPQAASRLDNDTSRLYDNELLIDVERLNIDSASFVQMKSAGDVRAQLEKTVKERGKQHNPVTGSGGMLLGRVAQIGKAYGVPGIAIGDRIATLVSLTLTPLALDEIIEVDEARHQVVVRGRAILFASSAFAKVPADLPETVALSALDVAGAAPQVDRLVRNAIAALGRAPSVLVLGCGGKSGLLCAAAAKKAGAKRIVGLERSEDSASAARRLGACTQISIADAADALAVFETATVANDDGGEFDLTISCVNVPDAEMGAILCTRDGGTIYFFSMATSFTKAALGAEGISRDVNMLIGNGYAPGHADFTLALLRADPILKQIFVERYG